jgi:hypothetical protein
MTLPLIHLVIAIAAADGEAAVLGHVAWSSAARGANRLAAFYSNLLELRSRLVDREWMRARFDAEYGMLAAGEAALDRPIGVVFVATEEGGLERVEFGYARAATGERAPAKESEDVVEIVRVASARPEVVAVVEPYVRGLRFEDDAAADLSCALDLAAVDRHCLTRARAWAAVAVLLLPAGDPRLDWIARADEAATTLVREWDRIDARVRFEANDLVLSLRVTPVEASRFERVVERAFAIDRSNYACPEPGLAAVGELGIDLESLAGTFADGSMVPAVREDRSESATRLRARVESGARAWIFTAPCSSGIEPGRLRDDSPGLALHEVRSADECGVALGEPALARAPRAPIVANAERLFLSRTGDRDEPVIGAVDFSLSSVLAAASFAGSVSERPSRAVFSRRGDGLVVEIRVAVGDLSRAVPRPTFSGR